MARSEALPPDLSARSAPTHLQLMTLFLLLAFVGFSVQFVPDLIVTGVRVAFLGLFFIIVAWRLTLSVIGLFQRTDGGYQKAVSATQQDENALPDYSVLIALRDEADMMQQLAASLSKLDWPQDKLDIILLIEADDAATHAAATHAAFPVGTRLLTVPPGRPLTKPRALNYGLAHARGELVTIFDAEDRPDPHQLRQAHAALSAASAGVFCVQAPLVGTNGAANWIASQWSLEYAVQFGLWVPALAALGHPVMLGGTSNHFRRSDLMLAGGWDAWNVTEDADLGLRAARMGARCQSISAPTLETAPESFHVWLAQRGRWIKGYIQTWLVCMRKPVTLVRELGVVRWLSLQLTLGGGILNAFLYGPMTLWVFAGLTAPGVRLDTLSFTLFGFGWLASVFGDVAAPGRWSFSRALATLSRPLYWPLQTLAAFNAIHDLAVRPFFWAKTPHQPETEREAPACHSPGSSPLQS